MLYFLSDLMGILPGARLFQYITFRSVGALFTASLFVFLFGPAIINSLRVRQGKGQPIRADGPQTHLKKAGTPTMGGLMILSGTIVSALLWSDLTNIYFWTVLVVTIAFGAIGFYDDYLKVIKQTSRGFSGKFRLSLEFLIAAIASAIFMWQGSDALSFPFVNYALNLGLFFIPFAAIVIVGTGNAVNFTDGLDGLAIVPVMVAASSFALITYISGNSIFANYLQINYVPGAGELAILLSAVVGAGLGFLWFNAPPAAIFMGDTGSLALGGMLGAIAVAAKHELILIVIGGVFVMEALSVIMQVGYFKMTGKRIFLMAPIHHHFEKKGWTESQVVIRFWIISLILALIGLISLKLR